AVPRLGGRVGRVGCDDVGHVHSWKDGEAVREAGTQPEGVLALSAAESSLSGTSRLKSTGTRSAELTGRPRMRAGEKRISGTPRRAAESGCGSPEEVSTRVESEITAPVLSTKSRRVTSPPTPRAQRVPGYATGSTSLRSLGGSLAPAVVSAGGGSLVLSHAMS